MAADARFWNRLADRYAAQPVADEASYQTKLAATRRLLRPDMEVFEFGCGTGSTALTHAPHVRHIRAVDFSARMIEIARAKAADAGIDNVDFDVADFTAMTIAPASTDLVMGHSILHLLAEPQRAVDKAFEILRPGGAFVTSTACLGGIWVPLVAVLMPVGRALGLLPTLTTFTPDALEAMQRRAGFVIEQRWQPGRGKAVFFIARKPA